uniref:Cl3204_1 n=1 Tax=Arundo donax TaxID=35708 RepID=A0A0A9DBF3_ARUDO
MMKARKILKIHFGCLKFSYLGSFLYIYIMLFDIWASYISCSLRISYLIIYLLLSYCAEKNQFIVHYGLV